MTTQVINRLGWLHDLPAGWEAKGLRFMLDRNDGGSWGADPTGPDAVIVLRSTEQTVDGRWSIAEPAYRSLTKAEHEATCLMEGDLLVTKSSGSETHIGKTTIVDADVAALRAGYSNFMQRLRATESNCPRFVWYLLNCPHAKIQLNLESTTSTGLANLNGGLLGRLVFPAPPRDEQIAIAAYLDAETARIDGLIEEKRKLLSTLDELRRGTISEAVAGGGTAGPRRQTGLVEFPQIPSGWDAAPLKRFVQVTDCKHVTVPFLDDGLPVASIREVRNGIVDLSAAKRTDVSSWSFLREGRAPQRGDLIFVRNASVGAVGIVVDDTAFAMGQDVCLISDVQVGKYLWYLLASDPVQSQLEALLMGSTIRRVNVEQIRNFIVCWPPVQEQQQIVRYLDAECAEINGLMRHVEQELVLLDEFRSATITDAVLGRIDVRSNMKN